MRSVGRTRAWTGLVVALGVGTGCGPGPGREDVAIQRLETEVCEKLAECSCDESPLACGDWPLELEPSPLDPVAFDPGCVERWSSWVEALSCQAPALPRYADVCALYHGTGRPGEPCEVTAVDYSDCGRGLLCIAGQCRDPQRTPVGGLGQPCDLGQRCEADLVCLAGECQRLPSAGEPCVDFRCAPEATCIDERCRALPGPGERCPEGQCNEGARCSFDDEVGALVCERLGDVGDPCMGHRDCVSGNCPAGFCQDPAEVGDRCSDRLPCGPGQFCVDEICQAYDEGVVPTGSACLLLESL